MNWLFLLNKKKLNYPFLALVSSFYLSSCATQQPQYGKNIKLDEQPNVQGEKIQSIYLLGNAGNLDLSENQKNLEILNFELSKADSSSYLFFLGDNVYDRGIVTDSTKNSFKKSRKKLQIETNIAKKFKGKTLFIPGNIDWKNGVKGLLEQENIINNEQLSKISFLPKNSCSIDKIDFSKDIGIITIDSQWFLQNWDKQPSINENCHIKSREVFFDELENLLNIFQNKTTIIAIHHPLFSNGIHGGYFDMKKQLYPFGDDPKIPLPIVGTFINLLRSTSGISRQDTNNYRYRQLASQISTLIENRNNVIVVSAHDSNLQYIQNNNVKQIISGSTSNRESAKAVRRNDFSYGDKGYAILDVYDNGETVVNYYAFEENGVKLLFSKKVTEKRKKDYVKGYDDIPIPSSVTTSVYPKKITEKSKLYEFLFGKHYRSVFGQDVLINTLNLKDYENGLFPIRMTTGSQTKNLLLQDHDNNEYNLRPIKKSATQLIQQVAFKDKYVANEFEGSFSEKFLMDFYTTNHPYYFLPITSMLNYINILHVDPKLFFVPKQTNLEGYNKSFGNEMYVLEDYNISKFKDAKLGLPKKIVPTDEMLSAITKNNKTFVDKELYVRARLFDMLVGNWDRTEDKWLWAEYKDGDKVVYKPISVEMDPVFPRYDGLFFNFFLGSPDLKHMQDYKNDIKNVKWLNRRSYPLDLAVLESSDLQLWKKEATNIQENLTEIEIRKSFDLLPNEAKQEYDNVVIENLISRKSNLLKYAEEYNKVLRRLVILKGTDKNDQFIVTRLPKGITNIKIYSSENKELFFDENFDKKETKEIRLYGLNGKDYFKVDGKPNKPILTRLIGGLDDDTYEVKRSSKVRIYDYANGSDTSQSSFLTFRNFINDYDINTYSFKEPDYNYVTTSPTFDYNPDDGIKLGFSPIFIVNGFDRNPYSQKHDLQLNYYFATRGFEAKYKGTFVKALGKWNLGFNAAYTSPAFSENFFGLGNITGNYEEKLGVDYNRVRLHSYSFGPSLVKPAGKRGSLDMSVSYSYKQVEKNMNRIVGETKQNINEDVFKGQNFGEVGVNYIFKNYDNESLPKLGMTFLAVGKWISNLSDFNRNFFYTEINLGFTHKISSNGRLTISSMLKGKSLWGENEKIEFYQMATMGGDQDFRGYRSGRFSGNKVFLQSSDVRIDAFGFKAIVPVRLGIFLGADYGRVWLSGESSNKWHTSFGGGVWLNGIESVTAFLSYFKGEDQGRIVVGLNFGL